MRDKHENLQPKGHDSWVSEYELPNIPWQNPRGNVVYMDFPYHSRKEPLGNWSPFLYATDLDEQLRQNKISIIKKWILT